MDTLEWLNLTPKLAGVDTSVKLWSVHDGPFPHIRCRSCDGWQSLQDSGKPFVHGSTCKVIKVQGALPWRDLLCQSPPFPLETSLTSYLRVKAEIDLPDR